MSNIKYIISDNLFNEINNIINEYQQISFHHGKRVVKDKKDNLLQNPANAKDNASLRKARIYANTAKAQLNKQHSLDARGLRNFDN